jgi:hypothetical protein
MCSYRRALAGVDDDWKLDRIQQEFNGIETHVEDLLDELTADDLKAGAQTRQGF